MDIETLAKQLERQNKHPPVEKWNPPFCGDMDIQIKASGQWHYMGTPIARKPLVKLLASVLTCQDGEFFLVTPVEKVRIRVDDAPFVITNWREEQTEQGGSIIFSSNIDNEFVLSGQFPLVMPGQGQTSPLYLNIHRGMQAGLHRNVYYQLAEVATVKTVDGQSQWTITSGGMDFVIGQD